MFLRSTVLFLAISLLLLASVTAQSADYPDVTFKYSQIFSSACAEMTKQPIDATAITELEDRLDSFREHWRREAPRLLGTTVKLTKAPFQFRETRAALSLCNFPSMSIPLMINMRFYLRSVRGDKTVSMTVFSAVVFHELLHRYVSDRIAALPDKTTPLSTKYKDEPPNVQNHIHVLAIMKAVYGKLGREKDLDEVNAFDQTLRSAATLKRAREIVDKEGAENLISEISKGR